ncbi:Uncharacterised protein [Mycobacterium tuberculosis]|nr:Uncharacterised protein [Mycobacterium tuberculosis]
MLGKFLHHSGRFFRRCGSFFDVRHVVVGFLAQASNSPHDFVSFLLLLLRVSHDLLQKRVNLQGSLADPQQLSSRLVCYPDASIDNLGALPHV